ncbi:MAG: ATP-dependent 6-phosphofructokinase [Candidatus Saccharicenans sp.]|jgi:6-phosphofructokinase 1|nr:ATP-dependent 6-phosphofructokinase [Candidatus Saccharicenans sp.]
MTDSKNKKGVIAILTGGGDVPGLNPAIRAITIRAIKEGYRVIGIRRGWAGLIEMTPDKEADNQEYYTELTEEIVDRVGRTGGTFLHTSRTRPSSVPDVNVPVHLRDKYNQKSNDLTEEVLKNLDYLGIDYLIPIGGDDTLSYAVQLHKLGVKILAIPKTMDNDVPGTDYCIGYSTCVTRTISLTHALRTTAGSHERFLVIEVFGRYAGYTALLPTMAGAADRCVIPEYKFSVEHLCELLSEDRFSNPSHYSVALISEGAAFEGEDMIFESEETDMYGHKKLGGIGDRVSSVLRELSPKYNHGRRVNVINQKLGYLVRCGDPDAIDSIVPMAYGNLALDLVMENKMGRMVCLRNGEYDHIPLETVVSYKKRIDLDKYYDRERLRPLYKNFYQKPFLILTAD